MELLKSKTLSYIPFNPFFQKENNTIVNNTENIFKPGIMRDRFNTFNEYRNHYQNRFFHFLGKDIFNDSIKLINNSSVFNDNENKRARLLSNDGIELQSIANNIKNNDYIEIFILTKKIYEEIIEQMSLLKNKQEERIRTKIYESENKKIDNEIRNIIKSITKKVKLCEKNIKNISDIGNNNELSSSDNSIKENIKINLAEKIQNFWTDFRNNEKIFNAKLIELGSKSSVIDDEDSLINNTGEDNYYNFLQTNDESNIKLIKRDEDITTLVSSINELSVIFKDLQNVIQQQGTILDRIDYNIDIACDNSKNACEHLVKANEEQKTSCFRNATLILMFIIFFELMLAINKYL